ncbi:hypothetical protein M2459_001365 [Parabacteroides sp. PF5-5]|nr:hypothetical protein [Parabacteroides sp. PF5-13]MDH6334621.1 hypothetical protein [Parabacteroides sp. PF5-5]MDH6376437.1 hypothetical protein [Parabacteroides sp. PH5-33]
MCGYQIKITVDGYIRIDYLNHESGSFKTSNEALFKALG